MYIIKRDKFHRNIHFKSLDFKGKSPVFIFWKYRIFKLKLLTDEGDSIKGELLFLAMNEDESEKCIIYFILNNKEEIEEVRYWKSPNLDGEICKYLVKAFLKRYM